MPTYGFTLEVSGIDLDDDYEWRAVRDRISESGNSCNSGDSGLIEFLVSGERTTAITALRRMRKKLAKMHVTVIGLDENDDPASVYEDPAMHSAECVDFASAKIFATEIKADIAKHKRMLARQQKQKIEHLAKQRKLPAGWESILHRLLADTSKWRGTYTEAVAEAQKRARKKIRQKAAKRIQSTKKIH